MSRSARATPATGPTVIGQALVQSMIQLVSAAAATYESRWTMRALKRVDADLCEAIEDQQSMFHTALITGEDEQIIEHGEAMCRGWSAAVTRMEQANELDDAYVLGFHNGVTVAIGSQRSASARVRELHGDRVVWLTPDEVACLFAGLQDVAKVKSLWIDAEIVGIRNKLVSAAIELFPDEPAQEDD